MGFGDELLGSGMARGARARGRRIAFGDGHRIIWSKQAHEIYRGNPNVAPPGSEGASDLEWITHYRGHRLYARPVNGRWQWRPSFRAQPGQLFFDVSELEWASRIEPGFVLIEPTVKKTAPNKQWPRERYAEVAWRLLRDGYRVAQFNPSGAVLTGVEKIMTPSFRHAVAALGRAALYIGPEGGLHHGAAAVGTKAVVIFGGFIHPLLTGYPGHANLYVGEEACGTIGVPCPHCQAAMDAITVEQVYDAAVKQIEGRHADLRDQVRPVRQAIDVHQ